MRKILAVLLMICAGFGLIVCVGGLVGVWIVNEPVTDAIASAVQVTDGYLALANNATVSAGRDIEIVRSEIDALQQRAASMTPETRTEIAGQITDAVQRRFGPAIDSVRTTYTTVRTGIVALNRSLESANRIPGVNIPTFTDELQDASQRLDAIKDNLTALSAAVKGTSIDGSKVGALLSSTSDQLASLGELLNRSSTQIAALRGKIAAANAAAPELIDWTSLIISVLLVLFGTGQICLVRKGLDLFRTA